MMVLAQAPTVLAMESVPLLHRSPIIFERIVVVLFSLNSEEGAGINRA